MVSSIVTSPYYHLQSRIQSIAYPILMCIGTVGCLFNINIFMHKQLRQNPCSIYLIAYNIGSILFLWLSLFPTYLAWTFDLDPSGHNLIYCRFQYYFMFLLTILCPSFLVLASIDRTLITSQKTNVRRKSTHRLAYILTSLTITFWCFFYSHVFVKVNIQPYFAISEFCIYDGGLYTTLMTWNAIIIDGIVPPTLMIIFTIITLKNINRVRISPVAAMRKNSERLARSKDRQFIILVFVEIIIYMMFSLMQPIMLLYIELTKNTTKSINQVYYEWFILGLSHFFVYIPASISFYCNLAFSKTFQSQFKIILIKLYSSIQRLFIPNPNHMNSRL